MKLYVLPVETACDASCKFCITNFRQMAPTQILGLNDLEKTLSEIDVEKIEITGGGEPTLHPEISTIIELCSAKAPTQMYTHGARIKGLDLSGLQCLCVSRAHYLDSENERIMGVSYDFNDVLGKAPIKLSLMVHQSGIRTAEEVKKYINWADGKAEKVVVRQLFEHDYGGKLDDEYVSAKQIFDELKVQEHSFTPQNNPIFKLNRITCEIELRSCACEMGDPVLHADGQLYKGWSKNLL